jgi:hypothetical protein
MANVSLQISQLPLYHGPIVRIRIGGQTYNVSKRLLCYHSLYFRRMFEGKSEDANEQSTELKEVHGVVSNRSFELLLQWLYLGRLFLAHEASSTDEITAMIELARLADMVEIKDTGMDAEIAKYTRETALSSLLLDEMDEMVKKIKKVIKSLNIKDES